MEREKGGKGEGALGNENDKSPLLISGCVKPLPSSYRRWRFKRACRQILGWAITTLVRVRHWMRRVGVFVSTKATELYKVIQSFH